jgi:DNA-binding PadR family transcriptional regulator
VLAREAASGYEIKKTLEQPPYCHFQDTGFGSIYPALNRLAQEGLVQVTEMAQEKRPDKKVYTITEAGRQAFLADLMAPPGPDRFRSDFLFVLFHGEQLPPELLRRLIDQRIADLDEHIARMQGCACSVESPGHRFVHALGLDYYRNAAKFLRDNRQHLLEALEAPPLVAE